MVGKPQNLFRLPFDDEVFGGEDAHDELVFKGMEAALDHRPGPGVDQFTFAEVKYLVDERLVGLGEIVTRFDAFPAPPDHVRCKKKVGFGGDEFSLRQGKSRLIDPVEGVVEVAEIVRDTNFDAIVNLGDMIEGEDRRCLKSELGVDEEQFLNPGLGSHLLSSDELFGAVVAVKEDVFPDGLDLAAFFDGTVAEGRHEGVGLLEISPDAIRLETLLVDTVDREHDLIDPRMDLAGVILPVGGSAHGDVGVWEVGFGKASHLPDFAIKKGFSMPLKVDRPDRDSIGFEVREVFFEYLYVEVPGACVAGFPLGECHAAGALQGAGNRCFDLEDEEFFFLCPEGVKTSPASKNHAVLAEVGEGHFRLFEVASDPRENLAKDDVL